MTTKKEISAWFDRGVKQGAAYMLVVCDSSDYEDYPSFAQTAADCWFKYEHPGDMQRVMEVYDLSADKSEQMDERRAIRLPPKSAPDAQPEPAAPTVAGPVAWRTGVAGGFVTFSIGNQRFRLAYAGDDDLLPSQQAAQLEWMRTMLHAALSTLATPPRAPLTNAEIMTIFRRSVKAAERDNTFHLIFARAIIAADRGEK